LQAVLSPPCWAAAGSPPGRPARTDNDALIKPIDFALAIGVAIDAFLVRMTLVPAVLALAGRHAWWLPVWLDRLLPDLDVEGTSLEKAVPKHSERAPEPEPVV
jgi:putative drug exporter of the RND superfamily